MSDESIADRSVLPLYVLHQIDRICDRLELSWARGKRPRIEDYLDQIAIPFRPALNRDLLAAEIAARRRLGENPCPKCGAKRPAIDTERLCPSCVAQKSKEGFQTPTFPGGAFRHEWHEVKRKINKAFRYPPSP